MSTTLSPLESRLRDVVSGTGASANSYEIHVPWGQAAEAKSIEAFLEGGGETPRTLYTLDLGTGIRSVRPAPSLYDLAKKSLLTAVREARADNWDGEGARAISKASVEHARCFLRLLSAWLPAPAIYPDPLGRLIVEWHEGPRCVVNASIGESHGVAYAWLLGDSEGYAADNLEDAPDRVEALVARLLARSAAETQVQTSDGE